MSKFHRLSRHSKEVCNTSGSVLSQWVPNSFIHNYIRTCLSWQFWTVNNSNIIWANNYRERNAVKPHFLCWTRRCATRAIILCTESTKEEKLVRSQPDSPTRYRPIEQWNSTNTPRYRSKLMAEGLFKVKAPLYYITQGISIVLARYVSKYEVARLLSDYSSNL